MNVTFSADAWAVYVDWQSRDRRIATKINTLIKECQRHPFEGTGKPEPLKGNLAGLWSRRINREHRLVYKVGDDAIEIVQCRIHY